jgi:hypothetical protein
MKRLIALTTAILAIIIVHKAAHMNLQASPPPAQLEKGLETATFGLG